MTSAGFAKSLPPVLVYEGGKVDDPRDPGGRTNQGVIQRVYDSWRKAKGEPPRDVYLMTDDERNAIFRSQFWDAVQGDKLPAGVDFCVFDGAVNSGPKQSIKWLQRAVGVDADGVLGAVTLAAVVAAEPLALIDRIVDRREAFLEALKTFKTFGTGWLRRTAQVRKLAKQMVSAPQSLPATAPVHVVPSQKAVVEDAKKGPPPGLGDAATGGGVSSGGLGIALHELQDQLTPFSTAGSWIGKVVVVLIVVGALLTIGGLAWRFWASRKRAKVAEATDTQTVQA